MLGCGGVDRGALLVFGRFRIETCVEHVRGSLLVGHRSTL